MYIYTYAPTCFLLAGAAPQEGLGACTEGACTEGAAEWRQGYDFLRCFEDNFLGNSHKFPGNSQKFLGNS